MKAKFNPYSFVLKDTKHPKFPVLLGAHYENGKICATDGYMLINYPATYPLEYEGQTVNKEGEIIYGIYPNYYSIIPKKNNCVFYSIDWRKVTQIKKLIKGKNKELHVIKIGVFSFDAKSIIKLMPFCKNYEIEELGVDKDGKALFFSKKHDAIALLMPVQNKCNANSYSI